jgi:hypothetical protein
MDVEVDWQVCDDVETLVATIHNCKKELTKNCFSKFSSAKILEYKVSAPHKICEFLLLSNGHKPTKDKSGDSHCHKIVTEFEQFKLYKTKMFGDSTIRLEAVFDIGEGIGKYWYGNIALV